MTRLHTETSQRRGRPGPEGAHAESQELTEDGGEMGSEAPVRGRFILTRFPDRQGQESPSGRSRAARLGLLPSVLTATPTTHGAETWGIRFPLNSIYMLEYMVFLHI